MALQGSGAGRVGDIRDTPRNHSMLTKGMLWPGMEERLLARHAYARPPAPSRLSSSPPGRAAATAPPTPPRVASRSHRWNCSAVATLRLDATGGALSFGLRHRHLRWLPNRSPLRPRVAGALAPIDGVVVRAEAEEGASDRAIENLYVFASRIPSSEAEALAEERGPVSAYVGVERSGFTV